MKLNETNYKAAGFHANWIEKWIAAPLDERLNMIQDRDKRIKENWVLRDPAYMKRSIVLCTVRDLQAERVEKVQRAVSREMGNMLRATIQAQNVADVVRKNQGFLAHLYRAAIQRESLIDDNKNTGKIPEQEKRWIIYTEE